MSASLDPEPAKFASCAIYGPAPVGLMVVADSEEQGELIMSLVTHAPHLPLSDYTATAARCLHAAIKRVDQDPQRLSVKITCISKSAAATGTTLATCRLISCRW